MPQTRSLRTILTLAMFPSGAWLLADDRSPARVSKSDSQAMRGDCERLFQEACAEARGGRSSKALGLLRQSAKAGPLCQTRCLTEPALINLHEIREFRDLMREIARQSVIRLCPDDEPGEPMIVTGRVVDEQLMPVENALIYVFHTNHKGSYSSTGGNATMGDSLNPRLFGYLRTGKDGRYEYRTIRPGPYPGDGPPAHVHYEVRADGFEDLVTELMFRDDRRLTGRAMRGFIEAGFIIAEVRREEGAQRCVCDLVMQRRERA